MEVLGRRSGNAGCDRPSEIDRSAGQRHWQYLQADQRACDVSVARGGLVIAGSPGRAPEVLSTPCTLKWLKKALSLIHAWRSDCIKLQAWSLTQGQQRFLSLAEVPMYPGFPSIDVWQSIARAERVA